MQGLFAWNLVTTINMIANSHLSDEQNTFSARFNLITIYSDAAIRPNGPQYKRVLKKFYVIHTISSVSNVHWDGFTRS